MKNNYFKKILLFAFLGFLIFCKDTNTSSNSIVDEQTTLLLDQISLQKTEISKLEKAPLSANMQVVDSALNEMAKIPDQIKEIQTSLDDSVKKLSGNTYENLKKLQLQLIALLKKKLEVLSKKIEELTQGNEELGEKIKAYKAYKDLYNELKTSKDNLDKVYKESNHDNFKSGTNQIKSAIDKVFSDAGGHMNSLKKEEAKKAQNIQTKIKALNDAINNFNRDLIKYLEVNKHIYANERNKFTTQFKNVSNQKEKFKKLVDFIIRSGNLKDNNTDLYEDERRSIMRELWHIIEDHGFKLPGIFGLDSRDFVVYYGYVYQESKWFNFKNLDTVNQATYDVYDSLEYYKGSKWVKAKDHINELPARLKNWFEAEKKRREKAKAKRQEERLISLNELRNKNKQEDSKISQRQNELIKKGINITSALAHDYYKRKIEFGSSVSYLGNFIDYLRTLSDSNKINDIEKSLNLWKDQIPEINKFLDQLEKRNINELTDKYNLTLNLIYNEYAEMLGEYIDLNLSIIKYKLIYRSDYYRPVNVKLFKREIGELDENYDRYKLVLNGIHKTFKSVIWPVILFYDSQIARNAIKQIEFFLEEIKNRKEEIKRGVNQIKENIQTIISDRNYHIALIDSLSNAMETFRLAFIKGHLKENIICLLKKKGSTSLFSDFMYISDFLYEIPSRKEVLKWANNGMSTRVLIEAQKIAKIILNEPGRENDCR